MNRPDFKITKISVTGLPGRPGYMVLNQRGIAPGFTVKVTTENIGDATKKTSETALIFTSGDRVYSLQLAKVPARGRAGLAHNETYTSTFKVDALRPPLGLTHISAEANSPGSIRERDRSNNELEWQNGNRPWVPVIPQEWTVAKLKATVSLVPLPDASQSVSTDVNSGFVMTFSRLDEASGRFVYTPYGSVNTSRSPMGVRPVSRRRARSRGIERIGSRTHSAPGARPQCRSRGRSRSQSEAAHRAR